MAIAKREQTERLRRNEAKWSPELMDAGWTAMPSIILEKQRALGLDPVDVNILLQLARHWWYPENPPHPSKATIAACLNVSPSTVQRHIAAMERSGFIRRVARFDQKSRGQKSNEYRFDGLIQEAKPYAEEAIKERDEQRHQRAARQNRKKPRLVYSNRAPNSGTQNLAAGVGPKGPAPALCEPTRRSLARASTAGGEIPLMRECTNRRGGDQLNRLRTLWIGIVDCALRWWPAFKVAVAVFHWLRKLAAD